MKKNRDMPIYPQLYGVYDIEELNIEGDIHLIRMSFEMNYHDWCLFQKSNVFDLLVNYLEELEKTNIPNMHRET